ncbi:hypothetical protein ACM64Y_00560 [Novispirillum sp. DQ9]|uniref:hypothetical protein n=1 Tax=Novispirillum sp. DQ9 TaxID=3398612 RepID=UPI003C7AB036
MSRETPWFKFFPADWRADQGLRIVSLAARGLWIEAMCIMHDAEPYGHLVVNGRPVTDAQLAALTGTSADQIADLVAELESAGVFSRNGKGVIYSRRMTRDLKMSRNAQRNGSKGGNPTLKASHRKQTENSPPDNPRENPQDNRQVKAGDKTQKPEARSQKEEPPNPPVARDAMSGSSVDVGRDIETIRTAVWRAEGLTEGQIATKRASTSVDGVRQVRTWLDMGLTMGAIVEAIDSAFAEAGRRGEAIRRPWPYLDSVMRALAEQREADKPNPAAMDPKVRGFYEAELAKLKRESAEKERRVQEQLAKIRAQNGEVA